MEDGTGMFTLGGMEALTEALCRPRSVVKYLNLSSCKLGPAFRDKQESPIYVLMKGLRESESHNLVKIDLSNNDLGEFEGECITEAIQKPGVFENVLDLNLADNINLFYRYDTCSEFTKALQDNKVHRLNLRKLDLTRTGISNNEKCKLFGKVVNSCKLEVLILAKNLLHDVGAGYIYKALGSATGKNYLKELDLSEVR